MLERIYLDGDQVILNADGVESADVDEYLKGLGCERPENLYRLDRQIYLMESEAWKERYIPFFSDVNSLWHTLRTKEQEPNHYFVIGLDQLKVVELKRRFEFYFALRSMLKGLCHHEGDDIQPMKYVFFSSKESYLKKLEVLYAISADELLSIDVDDLAISKAEILKSAVQQEDDVHCDERKHVMRETLVEFFKDENNKSILALMSGVKKFYEAYAERYKVYVSKFSVNKILSEIESERISFLCKIQDAIMSQQTKAFALPGGLVAVGAILRFSKNFWDFFIIFVGLLLTTWMVTSLNRSAINHIKLLGEEFEKSTSKYDDVVVGIEDIKVEITRSRERLGDSSKDASSKLSALTRISWAILLVVTLMLLGRSGVGFNSLSGVFDYISTDFYKLVKGWCAFLGADFTAFR